MPAMRAGQAALSEEQSKLGFGISFAKTTTTKAPFQADYRPRPLGHAARPSWPR